MKREHIDLIAKLSDAVLYPDIYTDTERTRELARMVCTITQREWENHLKLSKACRIYNNATNPWVPLSDFQHGIRRKLSKKVRNYIRENGQGKVKETDQGTLTLIA
jgi:hypothetical protein